MLMLSGYEIQREIYSGERSIVYRGLKENIPVIIKVLHNEYPNLVELNAFKKEYEILNQIHQSKKTENIVRVLGVEKYKNGIAIIFEDIRADAISLILEEISNYSPDQFLDLMILSVYALNEIHEMGLVHKDIKPQNIVYDKNTNKLQIIDFGSASHLEKQSSFAPLNSSIEGTLAYISPEQTGRMNRTVDYRTDYYSLGVTFYQILTKTLPFITKDPMELVHSHIAKIPISPFEKNNTNKIISDIVMKLLQKNPEDRYQSGTGILYDLEWCQKNLGETDFEVGKMDFSGKFKIPEKLYGRNKEISQIVETFKQVLEGKKNLVLISGRSGIGKSALINEINKPIAEYKGYFISGKYDQFKRTIPFHAIGVAFQGLIQQILTSNHEKLTYWKEHILEAVGFNGKIIIDIIPELEMLIGEQPDVINLGTFESQNRFNLVFQNFIKALSSKEHPIAIFLDDMQWADTPSINLIQSIITNREIQYLYLILSFRDNEVLPTDSFSLMLGNLKKSGYNLIEILLEPIKIPDIKRLVQDTLNCEEEITNELATILFDRTKGNPFFVNETFKSLHEKKLISFISGKWFSDMSKIKEIKMTENVIDLMVEKVKGLSVNQIDLLKLAACLGDSFEVDTLFELVNQEIYLVARELTEISNEGFLLQTRNQIRFTHDKIREAVYSLIDEENKIEFHYKIGKLLFENTAPELLEERIFIILGHLNLGSRQIHSFEEKMELIQLNLKAGKKAKASTAYEATFNFLKEGIKLLPEDKWEKHYELCLEIYREFAECEYLLTHFSEADKLFEYILENAKTILDKIAVIHIQLRQKTSEQKGEEAFRIGFRVLEQLGFKLPDLDKPETIQTMFMEQLEEYKHLLAERPISSLFELPVMSDPTMKEAISIITNLGDIAILLKSEMLPFMSILGVNLSLKYGNSIVSPISYVMWGVINNLGFKDFNTGYEFGQLSIKLNQEKFPSDLIIGKIYAFYGWNIHHFKHHTKHDLEIAKKGYEVGMANSDLVYSMYFVIMFLKVAFNIGQNLDEVIEYGKKSKVFANKYGQMVAVVFCDPTHMTALALQGKTEKPTSLNCSEFSEAEYIKNFSSFESPTSYFYLRKFQLYYLFEEHENAIAILPDVEKYFVHMPAHIAYTEFFFYKALLFLAMHSPQNDEQRIREDKFTEAYGLLKLWSDLCEENFLHLFLLIEAEKASVEGRDVEAMKLYEKSIESALKYDYKQNAALSNELAGKFYMSRELDKVASVYIHEARYLYKLWGAEAKVKQLEEKYPHLKRHAIRSMKYEPTISNSGTSVDFISTEGQGRFLDLNTVIKASQTISSEIQLGKLLEKMMRILFENAGAERGFFILKDGEHFYIEAEGNANTEIVKVLKRVPLEGNLSLSTAVINYVLITKKIVLLNDATRKGMFVNEEYIQKNQTKSMLCYPIINHGNLVGVVYLENNLTTDAFTSDRVEILKILSSQIAVSVENSLLYANLEQKVEERTKNLNDALVEVRGLKEQQDGDYFLNTLLIEPLGENRALSKNIKIDFFLKQKKNFIFRRNEYELGGDINMSDNIELQGRKYVVFLNGDAMGKSIQGAGGVLVLGTVFKSIIQRTISTSEGKNVYPERWLKNSFIEMHKAFEGFDGSMLMSMIFGLIDEITGTLYFINAEHPEMVLFRDGVVDFIEAKNQYRKLGTQGQMGSIYVEMFSLKTDDLIILGSDGRDDLILEKNLENGIEIINQDVKLFLKHVKKGEGNLERIYESLLSAGELLDDLSLLRIHFIGKFYEEKESLMEDLKKLEKYKNSRNLKEFTEIGNKVILNYPHLSNLLLEIAMAFKELGNYETAIDLGERFRLREPFNINNLISLTESYKLASKIDMAKRIFEICLQIDPNDKKLKNISFLLNSTGIE